MKSKARNILTGAAPALLKVLLVQFGVKAVFRAVTLLLACATVLLATVIVLPADTNWIITAVAVGFEFLLLWRIRAFQMFGQILCAGGVIRENLSQSHQAKNCFLAALKFLVDRQRAYEGLYRIAGTGRDMRDLAEIILANEKLVSGELALLAGRCLREAGDSRLAVPNFELADKLAPSDATKLELAEIYLENGSAAECLETVQRLTRPDVNGHAFFLRATALRVLGKTEEALIWANRATQVRPCDPDYQVAKGKILEALGRSRAARHQYSKAIRVHQQSPEALFLRAMIRLREGDRTGAVQDLERCYYYENTRTEAYLLARALKIDAAPTPATCAQQGKTLWLSVHTSDFELIKSQKVSIQIRIAANTSLQDCHIEVLEPFGWGVEISPRQIEVGPITAGQQRTLTLEVKAKRSSEVNLNQPWIVNLVLTAGTFWASELLRFRVSDPEEGQVFLVLTNDHEPRLHRDRMQPDGKCPVLVEETAADLIGKGRRATSLAEKYSFRWTFMLDAGTAIGLPGWAGAQSPSWRQLHRRTEDFYLGLQQHHHGCQVHLHLSGVPKSYFFCYHYDLSHDVVSFDLEKKNKHFSGWQINSWANVTRRYGRLADVDSRLGSLAHATRTVVALLARRFKDYRAVFFRAGQWDLGASTVEREKSIMALRECGFLADSSVGQGYKSNQRPFRFGMPFRQAARFTFKNNPERTARSLVDAGMLEAVPIVLPQGGHAVTPRDNPRAVIEAYRRVWNGRRVAPGRHIIMEIEHLAGIAHAEEWAQCADWKQMERHFSKVRRNCPALKGLEASEAIYAWFDYYSPELIVRFGQPTTKTRGRVRIMIFPLVFLGDGIACEEKRSHMVRIPLQIGQQRESLRIRILEREHLVFESLRFAGNRDLIALEISEQNRHSFSLELIDHELERETGCGQVDGEGMQESPSIPEVVGLSSDQLIR